MENQEVKKVSLNMDSAMLAQIAMSGDGLTEFIRKAVEARLIALGLRKPDVQTPAYDELTLMRLDALENKAILSYEQIATLQADLKALQESIEDLTTQIAMVQAGE